MHPLMVRVLEQRQLNSAGQLFTISDYDVITDLHTAFVQLKHIFNAPSFIVNRVDQSVVEIVVARITAAIRETGSIEMYCAEMVDVLDSCLRHKMIIYDSTSEQYVDSPHCKIATDLMSSLFLVSQKMNIEHHYGKKSVMTLAIPAAIVALGSGHADLVKSTTSYISLAAIHNSKALAQYAIQIISHISNGNTSLLRVLPQIYGENREAVHAHVPQLMRLLDADGRQTGAGGHDALAADRLSLLQLASIVANNKPDLLLPHLPLLSHFLLAPPTGTAVLHIFLALVSRGRNQELAEYLPVLCDASTLPFFRSNLATLAKVFSGIGRISLPHAVIVVDRLVQCAALSDAQALPLILTHLENVVECFPSSLHGHLSELNAISRASCLGSQRQIERIVALAGLSSAESRAGCSLSSVSMDPQLGAQLASATGLSHPLNRHREDASSDSISVISKRSSSRPGGIGLGSTQAVPRVPGDSSADASALELDKNTQTLAAAYQNRSSSSLSKQRSRSFVSVLAPYGPRGSGDTVPAVASVSRDLSSGSLASSTHFTSRAPRFQQQHAATTQSAKAVTLPSHNHVYREGMGPPPGRRAWLYPGVYETTFPATPGAAAVTTTATAVAPSTSSAGGGSHAAAAGGGAHVIEEEREEDVEGIEALSAVSNGWIEEEKDDRGDVVQQFVDHRRAKIRRFVAEVSARFPIPIQCTVEAAKGSKHQLRVHFACQERGPHCAFHSDFLFAFKTKLAAAWLHFMFLQMESTSLECSGTVLSQSSPAFATLAHCWRCLPASLTKTRDFVALVTSAFPSSKEQEKLLKELDEANYFDCFSLDAATTKWSCFACAHPDKVKNFVEERVLEGALKEKRGRWKFLRRWQTKYFMLSPAALSYTTQQASEAASMLSPTIDLKKICAVKSLSRGRRSRKSLRKVFEIFTADNSSYVLKASDERKAEEWMQCLHIAIAQARREAAGGCQ